MGRRRILWLVGVDEGHGLEEGSRSETEVKIEIRKGVLSYPKALLGLYSLGHVRMRQLRAM